MDIRRRNVLKLVGTGVAVSTAGCLDDVGFGSDDSLDWGDGDYPAYESWLPAVDGQLVVSSLEWAALSDFEAYEEGDRETPPSSEDADETNALVEAENPILSVTATGALNTAFMVQGASFGTAGLTSIVDESGDDLAQSDLETTLEDALLVGDTLILRGEVDTAEVDAELTDPTYQYNPEFDPVDDHGEFAVYEHPHPSGESAEVVAVGPDAIVYSGNRNDPHGNVTRVLTAREDGDDRATEENERFGWLLEQAGDGEVVFAASDGPDADGKLGDAEAFASSLTFDADGGATGAFAAVFDEESDDPESELEDEFAESAADISLEVEGRRITASATWDDLEAALEGE